MAEQSYIHMLGSEPLLYTTVPQLLSQRARDMPDAEAYVFRNPAGVHPERQSVTFKELNVGSTTVAAHFVGLGMQPKDTALVVGPTCPSWIYIENALMKIGVITLRLHMEMLDKIQDICSQYGVRVVIAHRTISVDAVSDVEHVFSMDDIDKMVEDKTVTSEELGHAVLSRQRRLIPDDPIFVCFTSGSTGHPKPVVVAHFNLINEYCESPGKSLGFIPGVTRIFSDRPPAWIGFYSLVSIACGVTIVYIETKYTLKEKNMNFVFDVLHSERITFGYLVPYVIHDMLKAMESGSQVWPKSFTSASTGGEHVPPELFVKGLAYLPNMINGYGSTEGGAILETAMGHPTGMKPIGHCEVKLVSEDGTVAHRGDVGELYVRSPFTFSHYLGNAEATYRVKDAFGWVKTGDMAKMAIDGHVLVLGRKTHMISRAGLKLFPSVIEEGLMVHPKISQIIAVGIPDERLYEEICACVVPVSGQNLTTAELAQFCKSTMTTSDGLGYMPGYFVLLDSFPLVNGKMDRRKLTAIAVENISKYQ